MRVGLVNPPRQGGIPVVREERHEFRLRQTVLYPISLMHVAALLRRAGHEVVLLDANARDLSTEVVAERLAHWRPDLVATRLTLDGADADAAFAGLLRERLPECVIVARSRVASLGRLEGALLERYPFLTAIAHGELETVVPALADQEPPETIPGLTTRKARHGPETRFADWDALPMPAYDLLPDLRPYGRRNRNRRHGFAVLESSRGCPYPCTFCVEAGTAWRHKSAQTTAEEVRRLAADFGVRHVQFQDETFTVRRNRVEEFARLARGLGVTWECNARPDHTDADLLRRMAEGGCRRIHFGVESLNPEALRAVRKGFAPEQVEQAAWGAWRAGIVPGASVILGLPGDDRDSILETVRRLRRLPFAGCQFTLALPYPGTPLHEEARARGWLPDDLPWEALDMSAPALCRADLPDLLALRARCHRMYYFHPMRLRVALGGLRSLSDLDDLWRRAINLLGKFGHGFRRNR